MGTAQTLIDFEKELFPSGALHFISHVSATSRSHMIDPGGDTTDGYVAAADTPAPSGRLLMIEDDHVLAATVGQWLEGAGYSVSWAESGSQAQSMLVTAEPDLILLDLGLPDIDGLLLCSTLKLLSQAPIIIASARRGLIDRVLGLKLGADDYLLKPLDLEDLLARVQAVQRRVVRGPRVVPSEQVRVGELSIEPASNKVTVAGQPLQLTPMQYRILLTLASYQEEIVSRQTLAALIWDTDEPAVLDHLVDVHVSRLRQALARGPESSLSIITVRGRGYRFQSSRTDLPSSAATRRNLASGLHANTAGPRP